MYILVEERRQVLRRCQDMKAISGNLGGTVGSGYIADIVTSGGVSASLPSVIANTYKAWGVVCNEIH
jgi:hypothetical protein